jgi:hypothetical protein
MSETQTVPDRDGPGIADILARREGSLPPNMLPEAAPEPERQPPQRESAADDAAEVAAQLRRQNEELQRQRTAAEARAGQAEVQARHASTELQRQRENAAEADYRTLTSSLEALESEQQRLRGELKSAGDAGDWDRIADINTRLGEIGGERVSLNAGKQAFEADRGTRLREPARVEPPAAPNEWTTVGAPRSQFMATRTPATQDWLRKNDRFFTDQSFFNMVTGADALARGRGIAADSPEYFRFIEEQAGMTDPSQPAAPAPPRRSESSAPPSAPPSREAPGPTGRTLRQGDTYITPEQKRVAEWMGVDPADYAAEEAELRRSGDLPHRRR